MGYTEKVTIRCFEWTSSVRNHLVFAALVSSRESMMHCNDMERLEWQDFLITKKIILVPKSNFHVRATLQTVIPARLCRDIMSYLYLFVFFFIFGTWYHLVQHPALLGTWHHLGPSWTILDHLEPSWTILDHLGPSWISVSQLIGWIGWMGSFIVQSKA